MSPEGFAAHEIIPVMEAERPGRNVKSCNVGYDTSLDLYPRLELQGCHGMYVMFGTKAYSPI